MPKMYLLSKITYGEFSEFVQEKKITYNLPQFIALIQDLIFFKNEFSKVEYSTSQKMRFGDYVLGGKVYSFFFCHRKLGKS